MSKNKGHNAPAKNTPAAVMPTPAPVAAPATAEPTAEQKRAATIASKRQQKIDERGYALPLVLTCHVTNKEVKYTSPAYIDKVIAKSPGKSLPSLRETFVSREGRRIVKAKEAAAKAALAASTPTPAPAAVASA